MKKLALSVEEFLSNGSTLSFRKEVLLLNLLEETSKLLVDLLVSHVLDGFKIIACSSIYRTSANLVVGAGGSDGGLLSFVELALEVVNLAL